MSDDRERDRGCLAACLGGLEYLEDDLKAYRGKFATLEGNFAFELALAGLDQFRHAILAGMGALETQRPGVG